MRKSKLLVTGSSGFIGSSVLASFQGSSVDAVVDVVPWLQQRDGSLLSHLQQRSVLDTHRPSMVLHLAWHPTRGHAYEEDIEHAEWADASIAFARECLSRGIRFICAGSAVDHYDSNNPHLEGSAYAESKRRLRRYLDSYSASQKLVTWLQIQYVFSITSRRPRLVEALLSAENIQRFLPRFPDAFHDFIEVRDVADGIRIAVERKLTGLVPIGSGYQFSNIDFVNAAKFHLGVVGELNIGLPRVSSSLPSALHRLGWFPRHTYTYFEVSKD